MQTLKNLATAAACGLAMLCAVPASATVVTVGNLSSDSQTGITTDTKSGRSYTRFDAFDMTYAQTLNAIAADGAWKGWSMATATVSDQFVAAALGVESTACDGQVNYGAVCGYISNWSDNKLGASYYAGYDYYAYLNSYGGAGLVEFSGNRVADYENWSSVTTADGYRGASAINYLLYKDAPSAAVPEPVSLGLFGLGLAGLAFAQRRRRG